MFGTNLGPILESLGSFFNPEQFGKLLYFLADQGFSEEETQDVIAYYVRENRYPPEEEMASFLEEYGRDPRKPDPWGRTPLCQGTRLTNRELGALLFWLGQKGVGREMAIATGELFAYEIGRSPTKEELVHLAGEAERVGEGEGEGNEDVRDEDVRDEVTEVSPWAVGGVLFGVAGIGAGIAEGIRWAVTRD